MSAALAVQTAIRARLTSDPAVMALVPALNVLDANSRPERFPCILIGEDQEVPAGSVSRRHVRVFSTLHVWQREAGLGRSKAIAGAVRSAFDPGTLDLGVGQCLDVRVEGTRYMRDPGGEHSHAIVTIETVVELP